MGKIEHAAIAALAAAELSDELGRHLRAPGRGRPCPASSSALRDAAVASVLSSIRTDGAASRRSQLASTKGGSRRDPCRPRAGVQAHAAAQQRRAVAAAAHAGVLQRGVVGAVASVDDLGVWLDHQVGQRAVRRERLDRVAAFQRRGPDARCIAGGTQVAADPVVITAELDPGIRIGAQPAGFFGMVGAIQAAGVAGRPAARRARTVPSGRINVDTESARASP